MPIQLCKLIKSVEEIQDKKDNAEQLDAAADEAMPQIAEQNDSWLVARDVGSCRYDQSRDDHLFDVAEYFPGGLFDMLSVECKPLSSDIPHGFSLRQRLASNGAGLELKAIFRSFNTTAPRSRSKNPDCVNFSKAVRRGRGFPATHDQLTLGKEVAALLCASETAFSQELTIELRGACKGDCEKNCKGTTPGGGRIIACLSKSSDKLTAECKKFLADAHFRFWHFSDALS
jgi:Cysteine rich repeat